MNTLEAASETPLVSLKLQLLITQLRKAFEGKQNGHCVRVDYLSTWEARTVCIGLRAENIPNFDSYLLAAETKKQPLLPDDLSLFADKAIELRNRKNTSLCLFIPADLRDVTASSLGNSFATFDITAFLKMVVQHLNSEIPAELKLFVTAVQRQFYGQASVSLEQEIDFLSAILENPHLTQIGNELWRVGLIPDKAIPDQITEWARRLELNRKCVNLMARPLRPQSSISDRITSLGLKPDTIQPMLNQYLTGRRLQSNVEWLRDLSAQKYKGVLTFECWQFHEIEPSDLDEVEVDKFAVYKSGLHGVSNEERPYALCAPKQKMTVRWKTTPLKPQNVANWRVAMFPIREHDEEQTAGVDLPQALVKGTARTANLSLDIDLNNVSTREVEVRVVALDSNGIEIRDTVGNAAADYTDPFYLESDSEDTSEPEKLRRIAACRCLADGLLDYSLTTKETELNIEPMAMEDHGLLYLPFKIGGNSNRKRTVVRLETTVFLRDLQKRTLENTETGGRYRVKARVVEVLREEHVQVISFHIPPSLADSWNKFIRTRQDVFRIISKPRGAADGLVETVELTTSFSNLVQKYVQAYHDLLDDAGDVWQSEQDKTMLANLLEIDTLTIDLGTGRRATVLLPTHPLRLLWYLAYARWVEDIAAKLRTMASRDRKARFSAASLSRIAPLNLPAFLARKPGSADSEIFADNLNLFYGVLLPMDTGDPGALLGEVARALGFEGLSTTLTDVRPEHLAEEIKTYAQTHPYLQTLRVNAINPGSGEFLQNALMEALKVELYDDETDSPNSAINLDLITHSESSLQMPAIGLDVLNADWYRGGSRRHGDHLRPGIQVARRPMTLHHLDTMPGEDAHIAVCQDYFKPTIDLETPTVVSEEPSSDLSETSAAVFGLLTRYQSRFRVNSGSAEWERKIGFKNVESIERHPIVSAYSNLLIEGQEAYLRLCACVISGNAPNGLRPALYIKVDQEGRDLLDSLHDHSDWVITLDRHFGVEYYDSPRDEALDASAERYLLDYSPEFMEGLGHRLVVTTGWQEEVAGVLGRALEALGLARNAASISEILSMLKMLSGRLALRLIGDENDTRAKEAVGLAVVMNYLSRRSELQDAILIPVDAHRRLFHEAKEATDADNASRCDILIVRPQRQRLLIECVETKFRSSDINLKSDLEKIADQNVQTERAIRNLYFADPPRLDAPIMRCQFASILRFYAERAHRHGRIANEGQYAEMLANIVRVETGAIRMVTKHSGYIVALNGQPRKPFKHGETLIHILTGSTIDSETSFERSGFIPNNTHSATSELHDLDTTLNRVMQEPIKSNTNDKRNEQKSVESIVPDTNPSSNEEHIALAGEPKSRLIVSLGRDIYADEEINWVGATQGSPHLFVLGIPGQGKSWTILRLVSEAAKQGVGSLVIDFHGQFTEPSGPLAATSPRIIDVAEGLPFSPFEARSYRGTGANYWKTNAVQVSEIFQYVCGLGEMQRDLVYEAISSCYKDAGFADAELNEDAPLLTPPAISTVYSRLQEMEKGRRGAQNTVARCRKFFEFDLFQEEGNQALDFTSMQKQTTIFDLHNVGIDELQMASCAFILRKLYKDMFSWGQSERIRLIVVLDEAHRVAKDVTLPKLMKEGRKFGICVIVASQSAHDFHPDVLQNAGTKIMFRTNYPISGRVAGYLRASNRIPDVAKLLEILEVGHALIQTLQMANCAHVTMNPYITS